MSGGQNEWGKIKLRKERVATHGRRTEKRNLRPAQGTGQWWSNRFHCPGVVQPRRQGMQTEKNFRKAARPPDLAEGGVIYREGNGQLAIKGEFQPPIRGPPDLDQGGVRSACCAACSVKPRVRSALLLSATPTLLLGLHLIPDHQVPDRGGCHTTTQPPCLDREEDASVMVSATTFGLTVTLSDQERGARATYRPTRGWSKTTTACGPFSTGGPSTSFPSSPTSSPASSSCRWHASSNAGPTPTASGGPNCGECGPPGPSSRGCSCLRDTGMFALEQGLVCVSCVRCIPVFLPEPCTAVQQPTPAQALAGRLGGSKP